MFMIDLCSGVSLISIDRQFSRKSRSRERDGYKFTAKAKGAEHKSNERSHGIIGTELAIMKMSRKKFHLVYEDERDTTVVMDIILKYGIKAEAKRREESKSMFAEL